MAEVVTLPKGTAIHPHLNTPDFKFAEYGAYQTRLSVPIEAAKPVMDKIAKFFEATWNKKMNPSDNSCWKLDEDDQGERTGLVNFNVKAVNRKNRKTGEIWDRKPKIVDAKGAPTTAKIGKGSTIRIGCELYAWDSNGKKGVSLQPVIVQVIELVEGTSSVSLADFGIEEEDGYSASDDAEVVDLDEGIVEVDDHDDF